MGASPVSSTGANGSKIENIAKFENKKKTKKSEHVRTLPNASGCIPTHPNRSVWVRMDPNALRTLEKQQKLEKMQKIAKKSRNIAKIFASGLSLFVCLFALPEKTITGFAGKNVMILIARPNT